MKGGEKKKQARDGNRTCDPDATSKKKKKNGDTGDRTRDPQVDANRGEMGRWGDGEMGRWGDGEMGRWGDGEMGRELPVQRCVVLH